jgi:hypothetical protein
MRLLFVFAAFFISITGICQQADYLIKNSGDTIWGDITLKNKIFYVDGISTSEIRAADVTKVKSRNYKGNTVVSCNLLTYSDNLNDLDIDFIKKGTIDTVLILDEIYATPKINLYYVTDYLKTPFYFYKTPADPKPLQLVIRYYLQGGLANYNDDRARYMGVRSKVQIAEDKGYVNQLYAIMGGCKKIPQTMWELLSYRDYSLKQIIKKYNKCN